MSSKMSDRWIESRVFAELSGVIGIPNVIHFERVDKHGVLFLEGQYGKTLEELFEERHRKFSLQTVAQIAVQLVKLLN
jgi:casein kinase 1